MRSLFLVLLLLFTGGALADTGGSMGGGNWGGGGSTSGRSGYSGGNSSSGGYSSPSRSYSSPSSSGWSSSSSSRSSRSSSDDGGSGCTVAEGIGATFVLLILAVIIGALIRADRPSHTTYAPPPPSVDLSVLRVAVDGRARKFVQTELRRIAETADTRTDWGRAYMLHQVAFLCRRLRDAWVYGGALNYEMRAIGDAKQQFDRAVDDARSRFREEVIRNADGTITRKQPSAYVPRSDEGEGLILISIIIAARRELFNVNRLGDAEHLRLAFDAMSQLPQENLVAVEVVWQPAEENDRMSSMELEAKYPFPDIAPFPHSLVGKTFCTHCSGPFPAELVSCPHCGAPAPGREAV